MHLHLAQIVFPLVHALVASAGATAPAAANGDGPDLGGPLVVHYFETPPAQHRAPCEDCVAISENEIERTLVYGYYRSGIEWQRIDSLIEDELARRKAEGVDIEQYEVSDEDFQVHYDKKIQDFIGKYPMLDVETEVARAYRSLDWYKRELRQEMVFDLVFIPDDPAKWPDLTFEALRQEAGDILIDDFGKSFERRTAWLAEQTAAWEAKVEAGEDAGPRPEFPPEDSMYRSILRQIVRDTLYKVVDTRTAVNGLPDDLIVTMDYDFDGQPEFQVTTEEAWQDMAPLVSAVDIADARLFLALTEAARQRLAHEGTLLSLDEIDAKLEEITSGFQSGMFDLGQIAVGGHQFPSVEAYARYFSLHESYSRAVSPGLEVPLGGELPAVLKTHLRRANQIMGLGKTDAEVLLVSAFDFANYRWIEDGWNKAEAKATRLMDEVRKNRAACDEWRRAQAEKNGTAAPGQEAGATGARGQDPDGEAPLDPETFWQLLIDDHCDFWDPPPPEHGRQSTVGYKQKGRFGERTRNDLRSLMFESAYHHYLRGELLTDKIFFDLPLGEISGPFLGSYGYYLTRVLRRAPATRPLNVNDRRHLGLLHDDYLKVSFIGWSREALDRSEVVGLPK